MGCRQVGNCQVPSYVVLTLRAPTFPSQGKNGVLNEVEQLVLRQRQVGQGFPTPIMIITSHTHIPARHWIDLPVSLLTPEGLFARGEVQRRDLRTALVGEVILSWCTTRCTKVILEDGGLRASQEKQADNAPAQHSRMICQPRFAMYCHFDFRTSPSAREPSRMPLSWYPKSRLWRVPATGKSLSSGRCTLCPPMRSRPLLRGSF